MTQYYHMATTSHLCTYYHTLDDSAFHHSIGSLSTSLLDSCTLRDNILRPADADEQIEIEKACNGPRRC